MSAADLFVSAANVKNFKKFAYYVFEKLKDIMISFSKSGLYS